MFSYTCTNDCPKILPWFENYKLAQGECIINALKVMLCICDGENYGKSVERFLS